MCTWQANNSIFLDNHPFLCKENQQMQEPLSLQLFRNRPINFYSDSPWTEAVKQLTFAIRENGLILILNSRNRLSSVELGANIRHFSKIKIKISNNLIFIYDTYFLMDATYNLRVYEIIYPNWLSIWCLKTRLCIVYKFSSAAQSQIQAVGWIQRLYRAAGMKNK